MSASKRSTGNQASGCSGMRPEKAWRTGSSIPSHSTAKGREPSGALGGDDDLRGLARGELLDALRRALQWQHLTDDRRKVQHATLDEPDGRREGEVGDVGAVDGQPLLGGLHP